MTIKQRNEAIEYLDSIEIDLSEWEIEFLASIKKHLQERPHIAITFKQEEVLQKIQDRHQEREDDFEAFAWEHWKEW